MVDSGPGAVAAVTGRYDVGGYWLDRPFKVRRLGHFGLNCVKIDESLRFYRDLLGFKVSDRIDFSERAKDPAAISDLGDPGGYFMRHGTDHHSFVLFNKRVREALDTTRRFRPGVTINQISWQVGSLEEVVAAEAWLRSLGCTIQRTGRDMPGSNWHTYFYDPDGHTNELFYGMEQVGWSGISKPRDLYTFGATAAPVLPRMPEAEEISTALRQGVDLSHGSRLVTDGPGQYDVGGVLLKRPFQVVRVGPLRLFVADLARASEFYEKVLGLRRSAAVEHRGLGGVLLRSNTEHHAIGLYDLALRDRLHLNPATTVMSVGMQVANYRQLREARRFLLAAGCTEVEVPPELVPGLSRAVRVTDPDGHMVELYHSMRQVVPEPAAAAPVNGEWPEAIDDDGSAFLGEPYLGPVE